jgi:hypothetical protein
MVALALADVLEVTDTTTSESEGAAVGLIEVDVVVVDVVLGHRMMQAVAPPGTAASAPQAKASTGRTASTLFRPRALTRHSVEGGLIKVKNARRQGTGFRGRSG